MGGGWERGRAWYSGGWGMTCDGHPRQYLPGKTPFGKGSTSEEPFRPHTSLVQSHTLSGQFEFRSRPSRQ